MSFATRLGLLTPPTTPSAGHLPQIRDINSDNYCMDWIEGIQVFGEFLSGRRRLMSGGVQLFQLGNSNPSRATHCVLNNKYSMLIEGCVGGHGY